MKSNYRLILLISLLLSFSIFINWDMDKGKEIPVQPGEINSITQSNVPVQERDTQGSGDSEKDRKLKEALDARPYGQTIATMFDDFTTLGIESYYSLYKHVPDSFENYIQSGIPLLIPNDYVSSKTYHLVDNIDINDTSGFTFTSDGIDTCSFEFVIRNKHINDNEIHAIKYGPINWMDFKDGGFLSGTQYFDKAKREFCLVFFTDYGYIFLDKYGRAPENIVEMLKNEGQPIEAGWKWNPQPGEYFEYGIDTSKLRSYHIQRSRKSRPGKAAVVIYQMHSDIWLNHEPQMGVDTWRFSSIDQVPSDVAEPRKFISSDSFYDGYRMLES